MIDKIMAYEICGASVAFYLFALFMATLIGVFLFAVGSTLIELDRLREARREWRKAKAARDAALLTFFLTKR